MLISASLLKGLFQRILRHL